MKAPREQIVIFCGTLWYWITMFPLYGLVWKKAVLQIHKLFFNFFIKIKSVFHFEIEANIH